MAITMTVLVAGCAATDHGVHAAAIDNFGEANRQTMAAQIIDPKPEYDAPAMTTGTQVAGALARLRADNIKKPERTQTSSSGSGSSTK
ncbi:MAG: hypothetical protein ACKOQM_14075 [Novosphingobium sp.]